jgi:hypothetical protein
MNTTGRRVEKRVEGNEKKGNGYVELVMIYTEWGDGQRN